MTFVKAIQTIFFLFLIPIVWGQDLMPFRKGKLWGFCNKERAIIIKPKYTSVEPFSDWGLAKVTRNGKEGLVDRKGKEVTLPIYWKVELDDPKKELITIFQKEKDDILEGLISRTGKLIVTCRYTEITFRSAEIITIKGYSDKFDKSIVLLIDRKGAIKSNSFDGTWWKHGRSNYLVLVEDDPQRWYLLDTLGQRVSTMVYNSISKFTNGFAVVGRNGRYTFINKKGRELMNPKYKMATIFDNGLSFVQDEKEQLWGAIDTNFVEVFSPQYRRISWGDNGNYLVVQHKNFLWEIIDRKATKIISFTEAVSQLRYVQENRIGLSYKVTYTDTKKNRELWGYVDYTGELVIPAQYERIDIFWGGLAIVGVPIEDWTQDQEHYFMLIDSSGKVIVDTCGRTYWDMVKVRVDLNKNNAAIVTLKNGEVIYIDKQGKRILEDTYTSLTPPNDEGVMIATKENSKSLITSKGIAVNNEIYEDCYFVNEDRIVVLKDGLYGMLDGKGKGVVAPKYSYFDASDRNNIRVRLPDTVIRFYIDCDGNEYK
jgi:hypothetical protein